MIAGPPPQRFGASDGIDPALAPPGLLVAGGMKLAMMGAAERDGELVGALDRQAARLGKGQMVGLARAPAADEAVLSGDMAKMFRPPYPVRLGDREPGFVGPAPSGGQ